MAPKPLSPQTVVIPKGVALDRQYSRQLLTFNPKFQQFLANPDTIGLDTYARMLQTDETVSNGFNLIVLTVLTMLGTYQHPKKRIMTAVQNTIDGLEDGSWNRAVSEILSSLWAGFSVTETVWAPSGPLTVPIRMMTLPPKSVRFTPDPSGILLDDSVRQIQPPPADQVHGVVIPRTKAVVMTHSRSFGNWYGESIFRSAYKSWLLKDYTLKGWAKAIARFGTPFLIGRTADRAVPDPDNPDKPINSLDLMQRTLNEAEDATAIVVPLPESTTSPQPDVSAIVDTNPGVGEAHHKKILYLNKSIYRAMLIPSLLTEEGQNSGSYALAATHFELFEWMTAGIRDELVEALVEQFVKPIILLNFGPQDHYGTFANREVRLSEKLMLANVLKILTEGGWATPEAKEDFDHVRQGFGFPEAAGGRLGKVPQAPGNINSGDSNGAPTVTADTPPKAA
jgi:hypothetical protein